MAQSNTNPDPVKDRSGCYKKGDVVFVHEDGEPWGSGEGPPKFVIVKVTGVTRAQAEQYRDHWHIELAFSVVSSDLTQDLFTIQVTNSLPGATDQAALTQAQVQAFLNDWNATVVSTATNSVTFTAKIYDALTSVGMWGEYARIGSTPVVSFSEQSYDQTTGLHTISADYSATPVKPAAAALAVTQRGGTVVSNTGGVIVFQMDRTNARAAFQQDIYQRAREVFKRRRWGFAAADVDAALAAGGIVTLTPTQATAKLVDSTA